MQLFDSFLIRYIFSLSVYYAASVRTNLRSSGPGDATVESGLLKMRATRMEALVNVVASRAEQLKRSSDVDLNTDKQLIDNMKHIVKMTDQHREDAQATYNKAVEDLEEMKQIPHTIIMEVLSKKEKKLDDKLKVVEKEKAKMPIDLSGNNDLDAFSKKERSIIATYAKQKREAETAKSYHENHAKDHMIASKQAQNRAMAAIGAAENEEEAPKAQNLYSDASNALQESRDSFSNAINEKTKIASLNNAISRYNDMLSSINT